MTDSSEEIPWGEPIVVSKEAYDALLEALERPAKAIPGLAKLLRERGTFWADVADDLEDPEFTAEFLEQARKLTRASEIPRES